MKDDSLLIDLVPEIKKTAAERYKLLRQISASQPVGRRLLAVQTELTERVVRGHVEILERAGLLSVDPLGISLTHKGEQLLVPLSGYFSRRPSAAEISSQLAAGLSMKEVVLVSGDSSQSETVRKRIGQEGALTLERLIKDGEIIAVSGGTTLSALASALVPMKADVTVVPSRGGFGERIEHQANYIAAVMADKVGGIYRMLHIPDGFSKDAIALLRRESSDLREVESLVHCADILAIGIGEAPLMLRRHQLPAEVKNRLTAQGVCGEALGLYADIHGQILYHMNNVGITLKELESIPHVLIVAGGSTKGAAILAMARAGVRGTLITDEGAAKSILTLLSEENNQEENT